MTKLTVVLAVLLTAMVVGGATYWLASAKDNAAQTQITVDKIQKIATLATIDYHLSVTHHYTKGTGWASLGDAEILVIAHGHIIGGVDMKKAAIDIAGDGAKKSVTITFKKDAITVSDPQIGKDDIECITLKNPNVFQRLDDKDFTAATEAARSKLKEAALNDGIKAQTVDEARRVLTEFLDGLGYGSKIEFESISAK